jgi:hypothetical protein
MGKTIVSLLFAVLLAVPASAQDNRTSSTDRPPRGLLRLEDVTAISADHATPGAAFVASRRGGDSLKNGAIAGLIIGGVIGAALAIECGHPECGPYFGMSAGLGTAIGVGVDALFSKRSAVTFDAGRPDRRKRPFARGRSLSAGIQKTW